MHGKYTIEFDSVVQSCKHLPITDSYIGLPLLFTVGQTQIPSQLIISYLLIFW